MKARIPVRSPLAALVFLPLIVACGKPVDKLWEFPTSSPLYSTPLVVGDLVIFGSESGVLHAVDKKGQARWQFQAPSAQIFAHPQSDGKLVFFGTTNQTFYAVDLKGQLRWQVAARERIKSDPAVVEGVAYFTSYDGHVYAVNAENGKRRWQFPAADASPAAEESLILTVAKAGAWLNAAAFEVKNLEARLSEAIKGRKDKALTLNLEPGLPAAQVAKVKAAAAKAGFDPVAVLALREGESFQAPLVPPPPKPVEPAVKPAEFSYAAPVIRDGVLYVGNLDGFMYALQTADGTLKWRFQAGEGITSTAWVEGGVVYFGSKDDHVYALEAASGVQVKWKKKTSGDVLSSPRVRDGVLAIGSNDGNFYLLDAATGQEKCHFTAAGPIISYGVFWEDWIFFGAGQGDGSVYAIDHNCQKVWSYKTGYKIESDPVIDGDTMFVTSGDMKLYAFKLKKP
ncbi:MAG: PQQ-binding-like beta-propeller repeat protein [Myxococcales bacterium]|nr:PQQ-binding-like beta-propeller repeat protein [Myxococcales bacterium]